MWIFLALFMVVMTHLFIIGIAIMALAAAAGVVMLATRTESATTERELENISTEPVLAETDTRIPQQPRPSSQPADHTAEQPAEAERETVTSGSRAA